MKIDKYKFVDPEISQDKPRSNPNYLHDITSLVNPEFKSGSNLVHVNQLNQNMLDNFVYNQRGAGSYNKNQYQMIFTGHDKYGYNPINPNTVLTGFVFITRPKLNLSTPNLLRCRQFATLSDKRLTSINTAIRCILDTNFSRSTNFPDDDGAGIAINHPLVNHKSPFIIPLSNCIKGISGFPDINLDTYTSEGGYYNEDQTAILGYDHLNRTYDLNLEITDIQGGIIMSLLKFWCLWMAEAKKGVMNAYHEDIDARRLPYTCSIYRFLTDTSRNVIIHCAKATGCFPKALPIGALFNMQHGEMAVQSAAKFSIQFVANKVEYDDPAIITDFNRVVKRFCNDIMDENSYIYTPINDPRFNYIGIPYIVNDSVWDDNGAYKEGTGKNYLTFRMFKEKFPYSIHSKPELSQALQSF